MGSWLYKPWDSRIPQFQTNPTSLVLNNMAVSGGKESSEPTFLSFKTAKLKWFGRAGLETQRQLGLFWVVFTFVFLGAQSANMIQHVHLQRTSIKEPNGHITNPRLTLQCNHVKKTVSPNRLQKVWLFRKAF